MKLLRSLKLLLTGDAETQKLFDLGSMDRSEDAALVVRRESSGVRDLVAGASSVAIPFGGVVTAGFLLLAVDQTVNVRINGGAESIVVQKPTSGRATFYLEGAITSVVVDNPGAVDATVLYALAGV